MKKIDYDNASKLLSPNRSLVKSDKDTTEVFVFSGFGRGEYAGDVDHRKVQLYSLSRGDYTIVWIDNSKETLFLVEDEDDVLSEMPMEQMEGATNRLSKILGKFKGKSK